MTIFEQMRYLIINYYPLLLEGIKNTLLISITGTIIGILIGLILAIIKQQEIENSNSNFKKIVKKFFILLAKIYVDIIRETPMIVQATVFFYGLAYGGIHISTLSAGIIIVSFNTSAYICEIIISGLNSINIGQVEAVKSLGLSHTQIMRYVLLPQAIRNSIPALMNELIVNIKDTSVLSVIGVTELFYMTKGTASETYMVFTSYVLAAIIYLILTKTFSLIFSTILLRSNKKIVSIPQSQTVPEVM